jgi:FtsP/CotA-like multicopper oxidase with cupredoxin domain
MITGEIPVAMFNQISRVLASSRGGSKRKWKPARSASPNCFPTTKDSSMYRQPFVPVINAASSSQFWIDLGALTGNVVAADGRAVRPVAGQRFPISMAQRLDVLIDLPRTGAFPVLARLEGSPRRTGIILATPGSRIARVADQGQIAPPVDLSLETRLTAAAPLRARPADLVRTIPLGGSMKPYAWSMDGEMWPHITPLMVKQGQRVEFELVNRTMMAA